jgi:hypothetical protein
MKKFEDILFYITIAFAGFTIYKIYTLNQSVPDGMCPVNNYSSYIYITVGLAAFYFVVSLFNKYRNKTK